MEEVSENSGEESALPQWLEGIEDRVVEAYRRHSRPQWVSNPVYAAGRRTAQRVKEAGLLA